MLVTDFVVSTEINEYVNSIKILDQPIKSQKFSKVFSIKIKKTWSTTIDTFKLGLKSKRCKGKLKSITLEYFDFDCVMILILNQNSFLRVKRSEICVVQTKTNVFLYRLYQTQQTL